MPVDERLRAHGFHGGHVVLHDGAQHFELPVVEHVFPLWHSLIPSAKSMADRASWHTSAHTDGVASRGELGREAGGGCRGGRGPGAGGGAGAGPPGGPGGARGGEGGGGGGRAGRRPRRPDGVGVASGAETARGGGGPGPGGPGEPDLRGRPP